MYDVKEENVEGKRDNRMEPEVALAQKTENSFDDRFIFAQLICQPSSE